jgi:predicted site-specific integrase-resolvase
MLPDIKGIENTKDDTLLTAIDVARLLGCTAQAVRRNIKTGKIKAVQVAGKWYLPGRLVKELVKYSV